jgi:hypothetical protein
MSEEEEEAKRFLARLKEAIGKAKRMIEISRKEKERLSADLPAAESEQASDDAPPDDPDLARFIEEKEERKGRRRPILSYEHVRPHRRAGPREGEQFGGACAGGL